MKFLPLNISPRKYLTDCPAPTCQRFTADHDSECSVQILVHGQVTIIFVVSVCLFVCLCSFSQPSSIRFGSYLDTCYMSESSCVP